MYEYFVVVTSDQKMIILKYQKYIPIAYQWKAKGYCVPAERKRLRDTEDDDLSGRRLKWTGDPFLEVPNVDLTGRRVKWTINDEKLKKACF